MKSGICDLNAARKEPKSLRMSYTKIQFLSAIFIVFFYHQAIGQVNPVIQFNDVFVTYGDSDFNLNAISNSDGIISYTIDGGDTGAISLSGINNQTVTIITAGEVQVLANQSVGTGFNSGSETMILTISKKNLTVTANSQNNTYGESIPALTFTYSGFVSGDDQTDLDDPPSPQTSALKCNSNAGTYSINFSSDPGSDNNYNITTVSANLTINKANLTVTALSDSHATTNTITYGEDPALSVSYSGFECGDKAEDLDNPPSPGGYARYGDVKTYPIDFTDNPGSDKNYNFIYETLTLTVDKANLTAMADPKSIVYGESIPALTFTYLGFVSGDDQTDLDDPPSLQTSAVKCNSNAGTYSINFSSDPGSDNNYNITTISANLTINKANLTVTAGQTHLKI